MYDDVGGFVEGEMNIPAAKTKATLGQPDFNTLDEPIKDTIVGFATYTHQFVSIFLFSLET